MVERKTDGDDLSVYRQIRQAIEKGYDLPESLINRTPPNSSSMMQGPNLQEGRPGASLESGSRTDI